MFAEMIFAAVVGASASQSTARPATIQLALVHRLSSRRASLELREADNRLLARCFDGVGLDDEEIALASIVLVGSPISLFQGPRRISQGTVEAVETTSDALLPCSVRVTAKFDRPLPITARGDVLWATNLKSGSTPREPVRPDVEETARKALPDDFAQACLTQRTVVRRGTSRGTYVGLTCPSESGVTSAKGVNGHVNAQEFATPKGGYSALVFVPRPSSSRDSQRKPRVVWTERGEYGSLSLVEVLDPKASQGRYRLVLFRDWPDIDLKRMEIWEDDGDFARPAPSEALAQDMMFLMSEELRGGGLDGLDDFWDDDDASDDPLLNPLPPSNDQSVLPMM